MPLQNSFVINFTIPGGTSTHHRPAAGPAAGQPGLPGHDRQRPDLLERRRHLRPVDRSPPDPGGGGDARHHEHDGDRHPDFAHRQRDRHGDVADARALPPSCRACRAPRAAPTDRGLRRAGRIQGRSPRSTPTSTRPATAVRPTARSPRPQPIDPYANKFAGNDDRTAVLGAPLRRRRRRRTGLHRPLHAGPLQRECLHRRIDADRRAHATSPASAAWRSTRAAGRPTSPTSSTPRPASGRSARSTGPPARRRSSARNSTRSSTSTTPISTRSSMSAARSTASAITRGIGDDEHVQRRVHPAPARSTRCPSRSRTRPSTPRRAPSTASVEFTADIYTINVNTATATFVGNSGDRLLRHHGPGLSPAAASTRSATTGTSQPTTRSIRSIPRPAPARSSAPTAWTTSPTP